MTTASSSTNAVISALSPETRGSVFGSGPTDRHEFYEKNYSTWERLRAVMEEMRTAEDRIRFLPKIPFEGTHHYDFRSKAVEFVPQSPLQVDRVIGAIYGNKPCVESDDEQLQSFIDDCDGHGTSLLEFFEGLSMEALALGSAFFTVLPPDLTKEQFDTISAPEAKTSQAAQDAAQERARVDRSRPVIRCWKREHAVNWALKPVGLLWAQTVEDVTVQLDPSDPKEIYEQRTTFREDGLTVERRLKGAAGSGDTSQTATQFEEVPFLSLQHGHDFTPLVELQGLRGPAFQGRSMIERSSRADINAFNEETWGALSRYRHANAQTWVKSQRTWKEIRQSEMIVLTPDEEIGILEVSGSASEQFEPVVERHRRAAVTQTGADPNTTPDAPDGELSGIAYRVRLSNTEKRTVEQHQRCVVSCMLRALEMAQKVIGREVPDDQVRVEVLSSFDMLDPSQHANLIQTTTPIVASPTFEREAAKQLVGMVLTTKDHEVIQKIQKEIDANETPTEKQEALMEEELRQQSAGANSSAEDE